MNRTLIILLLSLLLVTPSLADETDTLAKCGEGIFLQDALYCVRYFREGDADFSTSKCIGNPVTPICVVDTIRTGNHDLNDIARGKLPGIEDYSFPISSHPETHCFRLVGFHHYIRGTVPEENWIIEEGDVAITILVGGTPGGVCDFDETIAFGDVVSYLIRRGPYGWYVVDNDNRKDFARAVHY